MDDLGSSIETDRARWERLRADVHLWRGEMTDIFARAELAIGETLIAAGCGGPALHLLGPKYARLAELVAEGGSLAAIGGQVRAQLKAFRVYEPLRSTLCHGAVEVTMDEGGQWVAIFRLLVFGKSDDSEVAVFPRAEALARRDVLKVRESHLSGQLRRLRSQLQMRR